MSHSRAWPHDGKSCPEAQLLKVPPPLNSTTSWTLGWNISLCGTLIQHSESQVYTSASPWIEALAETVRNHSHSGGSINASSFDSHIQTHVCTHVQASMVHSFMCVCVCTHACPHWTRRPCSGSRAGGANMGQLLVPLRWSLVLNKQLDTSSFHSAECLVP